MCIRSVVKKVSMWRECWVKQRLVLQAHALSALVKSELTHRVVRFFAHYFQSFGAFAILITSQFFRAQLSNGKLGMWLVLVLMTFLCRCFSRPHSVHLDGHFASRMKGPQHCSHTRWQVFSCPLRSWGRKREIATAGWCVLLYLRLHLKALPQALLQALPQALPAFVFNCPL